MEYKVYEKPEEIIKSQEAMKIEVQYRELLKFLQESTCEETIQKMMSFIQSLDFIPISLLNQTEFTLHASHWFGIKLDHIFFFKIVSFLSSLCVNGIDTRPFNSQKVLESLYFHLTHSEFIEFYPLLLQFLSNIIQDDLSAATNICNSPFYDIFIREVNNPQFFPLFYTIAITIPDSPLIQPLITLPVAARIYVLNPDSKLSFEEFSSKYSLDFPKDFSINASQYFHKSERTYNFEAYNFDTNNFEAFNTTNINNNSMNTNNITNTITPTTNTTTTSLSYDLSTISFLLRLHDVETITNLDIPPILEYVKENFDDTDILADFCEFVEAASSADIELCSALIESNVVDLLTHLPNLNLKELSIKPLSSIVLNAPKELFSKIIDQGAVSEIIDITCDGDPSFSTVGLRAITYIGFSFDSFSEELKKKIRETMRKIGGKDALLSFYNDTPEENKSFAKRCITACDVIFKDLEK